MLLGMQFTNEATNKFIVIYKLEFNETLSREDATVMARRLVNLYRLFLRHPSSLKDEGASVEEAGAAR